MKTVRIDKELADSILKLAEHLLRYQFSVPIIERQFFFRFWCQNYLRDIQKLKTLLPSENKSLEEVWHEVLYGQGDEWLRQQRPRALPILRKLERKYKIGYQDVLGQVTWDILGLVSYPIVEYYLPEAEKQRSIPLPPESAAIVIHPQTREELKRIHLDSKIPKLFPRSRRKPNPANYIRTCACVCLVDRAGYGNRGAIIEWNNHFPDLAYYPLKPPAETQPGEIQFSTEKRHLLERFRFLDT